MTQPSVSLPIEPQRAPASPTRRSGGVLWLVLPAVSGVVVGILWWVLAPGGLNLLSGNPALSQPSTTDTWLPRDMTLAALTLVAGCATGLVLDGKLKGADAVRRLTFALVGAAAGGVVAWLVGLLLGQVWGPAPDPVLGPDYGFTLRSYAVLLLWPGALAFITLVLSLFGVLSKKPVK